LKSTGGFYNTAVHFWEGRGKRMIKRDREMMSVALQRMTERRRKRR
jgi:hypothetical protein